MARGGVGKGVGGCGGWIPDNQRLRLDTPLEEFSCATVFHNQYSGVSRNLAMPTEKERLNLWVYFLYLFSFFFWFAANLGVRGHTPATHYVTMLDTPLQFYTIYAASSDDLIVTLRTITSYRLQH